VADIQIDFQDGSHASQLQFPALYLLTLPSLAFYSASEYQISSESDKPLQSYDDTPIFKMCATAAQFQFQIG